MKRWIALALCLLLTGCASTYDGPVEEKRVLSRCTTEYYHVLGEEADVSWKSYTYDIYGNRAQVREYEDSKLTQERRYTYDERGNPITCATISHTGRFPHTVQRTESTYDAENRLTSHTVRDFWFRELYRYHYRYEGGRTTITRVEQGQEYVSWEEKYLDDAGQVQKVLSSAGSERRCFYDDAGNPIRVEQWEEGQLYGTTLRTFDDQGRVLQYQDYDAAGALLNQTDYTYTQLEFSYTITSRFQDGTSRVEEFRPDGEPITIEYRDAQGQVTLRQFYIYDTIEVPKEE